MLNFINTAKNAIFRRKSFDNSVYFHYNFIVILLVFYFAYCKTNYVIDSDHRYYNGIRVFAPCKGGIYFERSMELETRLCISRNRFCCRSGEHLAFSLYRSNQRWWGFPAPLLLCYHYRRYSDFDFGIYHRENLQRRCSRCLGQNQQTL